MFIVLDTEVFIQENLLFGNARFKRFLNLQDQYDLEIFVSKAPTSMRPI
jgi:hypothetical protein